MSGQRLAVRVGVHRRGMRTTGVARARPYRPKSAVKLAFASMLPFRL